MEALVLGFVLAVLALAFFVGKRIIPNYEEHVEVHGIKPHVPSEEVGIFGTRHVDVAEILAEHQGEPLEEEHNPGVEQALAYGAELWEEGEREQAVETLLLALIDEQDNPDLLLALGDAYLELELKDQALEAFERALEVLPEDISVLTRLAETAEEMGDTGYALELYQRVITINPEVADAAAAVERLGYNDDDLSGNQ
ncbi:MAG TPA: tetratricopeptide repeat protein [Verrucomicrobiae bacterium]|nr:tetratricopeptide repeat protein [Verrucomicrobiae bacterium]